MAGGARGIQDDGGIADSADSAGTTKIDFSQEKILIGGTELAAHCLQCDERLQRSLHILLQACGLAALFHRT